MQWQGGGYGLNLAVEVSRIDERGSLWGSDFSAFGGGGARTLQKRLLLSSSLGGNWRGFVDYRHSAAALPAAAGSLVEFSGLRADRWSMGIKGHGLFAGGDELRFSIRRQDAVRGRMRVRHVVATGGSFVDAFYRGHSQHLEKRQTAIDLGRPAATEFRLGYVVPLRTGFRLALGLEHGRQSQGTGVGLRWQKHF